MRPRPLSFINGRRYVPRSREPRTLPPPKRPSPKTVAGGVLTVAAVVLVLFSPYLTTASDYQPIRIDGDFSDWADVADRGGWREMDTQLRTYFSFLTLTDGRSSVSMTSGASSRMDAFRMWLDTDDDPNTGLLVQGIGADLRLVLQMWTGSVKDASLCVWQRSVAWDYSSFGGCTGIPAAAGPGRVEFALMGWVIGERPAWVAESIPVVGLRTTYRNGEIGPTWTERAASHTWRDYVQAAGTIEEWPWLIEQGATQNYPSNTTQAGRLKVNNVTAVLSPWNTSLLLDLRADPLPIPFRFSAPPSGQPPVNQGTEPRTGGSERTIPDRRDRLTLAAADRNESVTAYLWQGRVMARSAENVTAYAAGVPAALEVQVLSSWDSGVIVTLSPQMESRDSPDFLMESQDSFFAPIHTLSSPGPPEPLDISGNLRYWFRNTAHATETDCTGTNDKVASTTQGAGAMQTITLTTGQTACWYADGTTGVTIPAGDWETLLDIQTSGDNGGTGTALGIAAFRSSVGLCGGGTVVDCPKVAYWEGTAWGSATELSTAGGAVENVRVEWAPDFSYVYYIAVNAGATITVYTCTDTVPLVPQCASIGTATTQTNSAPERHWDIAIEQTSGDGLLVYDNPAAVANDLCYRTFSASLSLSGETCVNHSWVNTTNPSFAWIDLASNPGVNNIALAAFDTTNDDVILWMWDGTAFLTGDDERAATLAGTLTNAMNAEVAYEDSANEFVAYAGDGASNMNECEWTSAAGWEYDNGGTVTCGAFDPNPSANNDVRTMTCDERPGTNSILCGQNDDTSDIDIWRWVGASGTGGTHDSAFEPSFGDIGTIARDYDLAWDMENDDTGDGVVAHWDGSDSRCEYKGFDNDGAAGWSGTNLFDTCTGSSSWLLAETNPAGASDTTAAMVLRSNSAFDLLAHQWTGCYNGAGACMDNEQTLTTDLTDENYFHFDFAWGPRPVEYDVRIEVWNSVTNVVDTTIGTCLNVVTRGDDVQCLASGIAQQVLTANQVVRLKIAHSSAAGSVLIDYDDADSTGDSRATLPIPEFALVGGLGMVSLVMAVAWIRRRRSA